MKILAVYAAPFGTQITFEGLPCSPEPFRSAILPIHRQIEKQFRQEIDLEGLTLTGIEMYQYISHWTFCPKLETKTED